MYGAVRLYARWHRLDSAELKAKGWLRQPLTLGQTGWRSISERDLLERTGGPHLSGLLGRFMRNLT